jgi:ABC-type glutathione transport system ATPase component
MLLAAKNITKDFSGVSGFFSHHKKSHAALRGVSFNLYSGETLGIVGESGCGKTTLAHILCGISFPSSGHLIFGNALAHPRMDIQLVSQNPIESMDPLWSIGDSIAEPLVINQPATHRQGHIERALERVHLKRDILLKKPHECSGGQRQRAAIARAIITEPRILVCDEPTSHLDLSIQAQILNLLSELKNLSGMTLVFISHDLEVVHRICDRILTMKSGRIIEEKTPQGPCL